MPRQHGKVLIGIQESFQSEFLPTALKLHQLGYQVRLMIDFISQRFCSCVWDSLKKRNRPELLTLSHLENCQSATPTQNAKSLLPDGSRRVCFCFLVFPMMTGQGFAIQEARHCFTG